VMWVDSMIPQLDVKSAFEFVLSDDPQTKREGESFIPTNHLYLPVDEQQVIKTGTLPIERAAEIIPQIDFTLNRRLTKSELMIIEMLKTNNWERPMYFAVTVGDDYYMGLNDHFELTGLAYQILPIGAKGQGQGVNTDEMYTNMLTKFRYGGVENPKVYLDENILRMCRTHRMMFAQLVGALVEKGEISKAKKALDYCNKVMPGNTVRHDYTSTMLADHYYKLGESKKGNDIMDAVANDCVENLKYYMSLNSQRRNSVSNRIGHNLAVLNQILKICDQANQKSITDKYLPTFMEYSRRVQM